MRERSNRAVSKTVELKSSGGSNPPLSDGKELWEEGLKVFLFLFGKMSEWSMVQSWKGCVPKGTGGSNPPLSEFYPKGGIRNGSTPSEYEVSQHGCWCQCWRAGWSEPVGCRGAETESPSFR